MCTKRINNVVRLEYFIVFKFLEYREKMHRLHDHRPAIKCACWQGRFMYPSYKVNGASPKAYICVEGEGWGVQNPEPR